MHGQLAKLPPSFEKGMLHAKEGGPVKFTDTLLFDAHYCQIDMSRAAKKGMFFQGLIFQRHFCSCTQSARVANYYKFQPLLIFLNISQSCGFAKNNSSRQPVNAKKR
jgi:hypothetical protein